MSLPWACCGGRCRLSPHLAIRTTPGIYGRYSRTTSVSILRPCANLSTKWPCCTRPLPMQTCNTHCYTVACVHPPTSNSPAILLLCSFSPHIQRYPQAVRRSIRRWMLEDRECCMRWKACSEGLPLYSTIAHGLRLRLHTLNCQHCGAKMSAMQGQAVAHCWLWHAGRECGGRIQCHVGHTATALQE